MNRVVREGVFETNSSSTHSITISENKTFDPDTLTVNSYGECIIYPGEYGWEIEEYNDAATKASYALTWAANYGNEDHLHMLRRVIESGLKDKDIRVIFEITNTGNWNENGYIDHQSDYVCKDAFHSDEALYAFIFNKESVLYTDNDNH